MPFKSTSEKPSVKIYLARIGLPPAARISRNRAPFARKSPISAAAEVEGNSRASTFPSPSPRNMALVNSHSRTVSNIATTDPG